MLLEYPECTSYNILDDQTRNIKYVRADEMCDNRSAGRGDFDYAKISPDWQGPAWYRFMGAAGTRISEGKQPKMRCNTGGTSYILQQHPTKDNEKVDVKICFAYDKEENDDIEDCRWSVEGKITNCKNFFVYYLPETYFCTSRYCGTD